LVNHGACLQSMAVGADCISALKEWQFHSSSKGTAPADSMPGHIPKVHLLQHVATGIADVVLQHMTMAWAATLGFWFCLLAALLLPVW